LAYPKLNVSFKRGLLSLPWVTTVSIYEILYGLGIGPSGKRIESLTSIFEKQIMEYFQNRILLFDLSAAELAAKLAAKRKLSGLNIDMIDIQIAGIALANNATLATRNIKHFEDTEIKLINPWQSELANP
jgi:toxin FitB